MNTSYFVHLITDYGVGDPAFGEVIQKLKMLERSLEIYPTSVPPFSTIATAFWIAQYSLFNTFPGLAIYSNTAPRKDQKKARQENAGEGLVFIRLKNKVPVIAINAGYNLSLLKPEIVQFRKVKVLNKGSQFRSRDFYPEAVVKILNGDKEILGENLNVSIIPNLPPNRIASIDGYGNIKTTVRKSEVNLEEGQKIKIQINNSSQEAYFVKGNFSVREGDLSFAPGSSGGENGFLEIFLRGGSASKLFNNPKVEDTIRF